MSNDDVPSLPLFGEPEGGTCWSTNLCCRNLIVIITCIIVLITTIRTFVPFHTVLEIFFLACIIMIFASHVVLILWYRGGALDPKFKKLIYYNTLSIILLCICANLYLH